MRTISKAHTKYENMHAPSKNASRKVKKTEKMLSQFICQRNILRGTRFFVHKTNPHENVTLRTQIINVQHIYRSI